MASSTIYYPAILRDRWWPDPLAAEWRARYPEIFDERDFEQTVSQPGKHFCEWFTAVHIFHSSGYLSLIEKAEFGKRHPRKQRVVDRVLSPERQLRLREICSSQSVQWPDLLVYDRLGPEMYFAEAKGPGDTLSPEQIASHEAIERELGIEVVVYHLKPAPPAV